MHGIALLSEIHPRGINFYNPVGQAIEWYKLFSDKDIAEFSRQGMTLKDVIALIDSRFRKRNLSLILRDWAHLDFLGVPFVDEPSGRPELAEMLASRFSVKCLYLVRHPVDIWQSLIKDPRLKAAISLEQFISAYFKYAQFAASGHMIRYEDFTRDPHGQLENACDVLDLPFDPEFVGKWYRYRKITGDPYSFSRTTISPGKPGEMPAELHHQLGHNPLYHKAVTLLDYSARL